MIESVDRCQKTREIGDRLIAQISSMFPGDVEVCPDFCVNNQVLILGMCFCKGKFRLTLIPWCNAKGSSLINVDT